VVIGFGLYVFTATHAVAMPQDMPCVWRLA